MEGKTDTGALEDVFKVVGFSLGGQEYAVDILCVREIKMLMPITRVPKAAAYVDGVVNLRGDIVSIINLRRKLQLPDAQVTDDSRIIVIDQDGPPVGIIVDRVSDVHVIPASALKEAPPVVSGIDPHVIRGVAAIGERTIIVIDIDRILAPGEENAGSGAPGDIP